MNKLIHFIVCLFFILSATIETYAQTPSISDFGVFSGSFNSPGSKRTDGTCNIQDSDILTIQGTNLIGSTTLSVNGIAIPLANTTATGGTLLYFTLPEISSTFQNYTGLLRVDNAGSFAQSAQVLTVTFCQFSQNTSYPALGTKFRLKGSDLNQVTAADWGGTPANVQFVGSELLVDVPNSLTPFTNYALNLDQEGLINLGNFQVVVAPKITSLNGGSNVSKFSVGQTMNIQGNNFSTLSRDEMSALNGASFSLPLSNSGSSTAFQLALPQGSQYDKFSLANTITGLSGEYFIPAITTFVGGGSISGSGFYRSDETKIGTYLQLTDVNTDGRLDYLHLNVPDIQYFRNDGTVTGFTLAQTATIPSSSSDSEILTADLDNDGLEDILITDASNQKIHLLKNIGGGFGSLLTLTFPGSVTNISNPLVSDLDGDGLKDIIMLYNSGFTNSDIYVIKNENLFTWSESNFSQPILLYPLNSLLGISGINGSLQLADFNNDSKVELVYSYTNSSSQSFVMILDNFSPIGSLSGAYFSLSNSLSMTEAPYPAKESMKIADLNSDGKMDIVQVSNSNTINIYKNTNTGTNTGTFFTEIAISPSTTAGVSIPFVEVNDINGDGRPDIICAIPNDVEVKIIENNSSGGLISFLPNGLSLSLNTSNTTYLKIGDIDFDNKPDVLAKNGNELVLHKTFIPCLTPFASFSSSSGTVLQNNPYSIQFTVGSGNAPLNYQIQIETTTGVWVGLNNFNNVFSTSGIINSVPNTILSGFNSTPLSVNGFSLRLVISNTCGSQTVSGVSISVSNTCVSPIVVTQPSASSAICDSQSDLILTSSATGIYTSSQWQTFDGVNWVNLADNANFSGTATETLTIVGANTSFNNTSYRLVFSGVCGNIASNFATLTIVSAPIITFQPQSPGPVCEEDGRVLIDAVASGRNLSYRWQSQNPQTSLWTDLNNSTIFQGVFTPTLTIDNPLISLSGFKFRIKVNGLCANTLTGVLSDGNATLSVFGTLPVVITQPIKPSPVCSSADTTFLTVKSVNGVDLNFQWEHFVGNWQSIAESYYYRGTNTDSLTLIDMDTTENNRKFRVKISGLCSQSITYSDSNISINVYKRPQIVSTLSGTCIYGSSKLSIISDTVFKTYQWKIDSAYIANSTASGIDLVTNGFYSVYVNDNEKCISKGFSYTFQSGTTKPSIIAFGSPKDTLLQSSLADTYQWYVNDLLIQGAKSSVLGVRFNGIYKVVASFSNGCRENSDPYIISNPDYLDVSKADAEFTDSTILFLNPDKMGEINLVPNPTINDFKVIYWSYSSKIPSTSVYNVMGNKIAEKEMLKISGNSFEVSFSELKLVAGIYQIKVTDGVNVKWSKLVVY